MRVKSVSMDNSGKMRAFIHGPLVHRLAIYHTHLPGGAASGGVPLAVPP